MASMMDEMQKTLARRRAKVDKGEDVSGILDFVLASANCNSMLIIRKQQQAFKGLTSVALENCSFSA